MWGPWKKNTVWWIIGGFLLFTTDYYSTLTHFKKKQIEISLKICLKMRFGWVIWLFLCLSRLSAPGHPHQRLIVSSLPQQ